MAVHDFNAQRLFCDWDMSIGTEISCSSDQANYLLNVLRLTSGDVIHVFNGRDGEWRASIIRDGKRKCSLAITEQLREQVDGPQIDYFFAPLKRARLDYMVQKATELGVARMQPVFTRHTVADRVNLDRMRANVIEAAEQCGILRIPDISEPQKLSAAIADWPEQYPLIFADEGADLAAPLTALGEIPRGRCGVLIGPEGGFSPDEREMLLDKPCVVRLSLGPRIMRADTAAVAALSLINATLGDWQDQ